MDIGQQRQPLLRQLVVEQRTGEAGLPFLQVVPVDGVGHAAARPVGLEQRRQGTQRADQRLGQRRHRQQTLRVDQDRLMRRRQGEAAGVGRGVGVGAGEDAYRRLLLEPFPDVAFGGRGPGGQLGGGGGTSIGEGLVEAEAIAQIDGQQLDRA